MKCDRCGSDYADNYYKDKYTDETICEDCLLEVDGITTSSITYYYLDGEYMGNDAESIQDVIDCICDNTSYEEIKKEDSQC